MEILQLVLYGTILGSILALGAVGVSLTFGILRFANFSHGDLMTIGAYVVFVVFTVMKLPLWLAIIVSLAVTAALTAIIDKLIYRNFRNSDPVILLISSFGMALILRSLIQLIWGPSTQVYEKGIQLAIKFGGGLRIKPDQIIILVGTVLLIIALHLFLRKTKMGKAMRAVADNAELARLTGINTEKVILCTWLMGGALAAAAGIFLGLDTRVFPEMGWNILLPVFAAAILGGIGNPYGAIAGGLVIGISQELSTQFIDPSYKPAVAFAIMVVILIVRPTGIFAGRSS
ncbi:branched-chain amino acid ABC transporter permease [Aestuariispira insulae]|uniref:Neutral amino acid ABC transporter membrane protein n=1 Tax=Aestuariispira insulae TaxID=1461337 RepID=A0A3D9HNH8_9PROT|nr:branched-chain amino acid ABC transporter permease [Aestuariispira insulae]RED51057.1 neutral amino acid ABC transporter membrane protein [Aestuariispira insulae]